MECGKFLGRSRKNGWPSADGFDCYGTWVQFPERESNQPSIFGAIFGVNRGVNFI